MSIINHISIPEPCTQAWDDMTPAGNGRHCSLCAKTVIDFSKMSDAAVINYLASAGHACGRLSVPQMERINFMLDKPGRKTSAWKKLLAAASVLAFITTAKANVAVKAGKPATVSPYQKNQIDSIPHTAKAVILKGIVLDTLDNQPLVGATVTLKGTGIATYTDVDGQFTLEAPVDTGTLVVRYIGYKTTEVDIEAGKTTPYKIVISSGPRLDSIVVVGGIVSVRRPFFSRWWHRIKRLF